MNKTELYQYLLSEEKKGLIGWDFSYLDGRWENDELPWSYKNIILSYLEKDMKLLDIGTGGGEFLLTLNHPYLNTAVLESYPPNIKLCQDKLAPLGISVYPVEDTMIASSIKDNTFGIIIDRHEYFNVGEVKRLLQDNGIFITQQVGSENNKDLATYFDPNHQDQFPDATLEKVKEQLLASGFEILFMNEYQPKLRFFDLGALVYFAKIINWEFLNFSVENSFDKLLELQKTIDKNGYVESTEQRFIIVARNHKGG